MFGWELEPSDYIAFLIGAGFVYSLIKTKGYIQMLLDRLIAAVNSLEAAGHGLSAAADQVKAGGVDEAAMQGQIDRINSIATSLTQATARLQG